MQTFTNQWLIKCKRIHYVLWEKNTQNSVFGTFFLRMGWFYSTWHPECFLFDMRIDIFPRWSWSATNNLRHGERSLSSIQQYKDISKSAKTRVNTGDRFLPTRVRPPRLYYPHPRWCCELLCTGHTGRLHDLHTGIIHSGNWRVGRCRKNSPTGQTAAIRRTHVWYSRIWRQGRWQTWQLHSLCCCYSRLSPSRWRKSIGHARQIPVRRNTLVIQCKPE